jgi:hypothetical protein
MEIDLTGQVLITNRDFSRIYIQQCKKEGLIPAIEHLKSGEVFTGDDHRDAYAKRRHKLPDEGKTLAESADKGCEKRYKQGFVNEDGDFMTRDQVEKRFGFRYSETVQEEI